MVSLFTLSFLAIKRTARKKLPSRRDTLPPLSKVFERSPRKVSEHSDVFSRLRLLLSAGEKSHPLQLQQAIWDTGHRQEKTAACPHTIHLLGPAQYILGASWQLAEFLLLMENQACDKANPVFSSLQRGHEIGKKTLQEWRGRSLRL